MKWRKVQSNCTDIVQLLIRITKELDLLCEWLIRFRSNCTSRSSPFKNFCYLTIFWMFKFKHEVYFLQANLCQNLFFLQNMGSTCCVRKMFWMSETNSVHNMFSPGLSLEFSCFGLVIQWTICRHIVGYLMPK